jgi:hypothetical protein
MFQAIRKRFSASGVLAVIALVFAMTGGAYAAGAFKITKISQISASVQKQLRGKTGPKGATGPAGPAGLAGSTGPAGAAGVGTPGPEGKPGSPGEPGEPGAEGKEGQPWTPNNVLPSKATETGTWSDSAFEGNLAVSPITFNIQLKEALTESQVHFLLVGETDETHCKGGSVEKPKASPGNLCVFEDVAMSEIEPFGFGAIKDPSQVLTSAPGASVGGALIMMLPHEGSLSGTAWGTWAVTAP